MSEYQYYEWQTIDRLLTEAEQDAVRALSSHIEVTASRAVVTCSWSDFKHDPRQVLARYFDAHVYFANWGTRVLMFRFPAGLLDQDALTPYLVDDLISVSSGAKTPSWNLRSSWSRSGKGSKMKMAAWRAWPACATTREAWRATTAASTWPGSKLYPCKTLTNRPISKSRLSRPAWAG